MKDKIKDIMLAVIGIVVVPVVLFIAVVSWIFRKNK